MKLYKIVLPCVLVLASIVVAQYQTPDRETKAEAMESLSKLVGEWEGEGWMDFNGRKSEFIGHEIVSAKIDGLALVIEGEHKMVLPDGTERMIHDALGVITYNSEKEHYDFMTHLANGRSGQYIMTELESGDLQWELPESRMGKMKYTITVDGDQWTETGMVSQDGKDWKKFFEMKMVKNSRN